ncbi:hypothetical protein BC937DRAFT_91305 [Endogone sp. FLAS-F59071]|nr:hypothetical protein BC937DRAFT_91305 [Endogone sp. FLAS-F59071]|eukprot:RUS21845.1 hypothetical protein BC937DRAFT_91305 [Endogone sp. FLAS-F59071]
MDVMTLRKYKRVHKIRFKGKQREDLVSAVTRHFANQNIKEIDAVTTFLYSVHNKGEFDSFSSLLDIGAIFCTGVQD